MPMTEFEIYSFLHDNRVEHVWQDGVLALWIPFDCLASFTDLIGRDYFADRPCEVVLNFDTVVLDLAPICESLGLDVNLILQHDL